MLIKSERLKIFNILKIWSNLGLLPFHVDLANSTLNARSKGKDIIAVVSYSLLVLHTLYKNGSLAHAYFFVPNVELHQFVIHVLVAIASVMITFWYYSTYASNPALFSAYVNITLLGNTGACYDPKDEIKRHWSRRLPEYSKQDLIAIGLPYISLLAAIVISGSYVYDPSMRLLLYSALPSSLQNWATFGMCQLEEVRFLVSFVALATPIWQLQVISFDLVCNQLRRMKETMQNETHSARDAFTYLRRLQLYVTIVNNVNSYLIFTWKLLSISFCILSGYAAIAHFQAYPVFGVMYYLILIDVTFIYTLIYEKAFKIPELFGQVAASSLLHMRGKQRGGLRRQILSIPRTGVKVGNFHTMERASTLIFMDFVVKNIVNMLVAYG